MSQAPDLSNENAFVRGFDFDFFAELRAHGGPYWQPATDRSADGDGFWVVSRYHDVVAVLSDPSRFGSAGNAVGARRGTTGTDAELASLSMSTTDGARHQQLRTLAGRGITQAWLRDYATIARRRAREALDRVLDLDSVEFVAEVARDLGSHTLFDLLGVPDADRARIVDWTYGTPDGPSSDEGKSAREAYFRELVAEGNGQPGAGLLREMLGAQAERRAGSYLTTPEILAFVHLVYPAGANACAAAIAGAVKAFAEAPDQYARLLDEPGTLDTAVEEVLRWITPAMYSLRTACTDIKLDGCPILAGQRVTAWLASANRDERVFANPDRFDVARAPNPHLAFGHGTHGCPGIGLARLAVQAFLDAARETVASFELIGDAAWAPDIRFHCLARLPVRLVRR